MRNAARAAHRVPPVSQNLPGNAALDDLHVPIDLSHVPPSTNTPAAATARRIHPHTHPRESPLHRSRRHSSSHPNGSHSRDRSLSQASLHEHQSRLPPEDSRPADRTEVPRPASLVRSGEESAVHSGQLPREQPGEVLLRMVSSAVLEFQTAARFDLLVLAHHSLRLRRLPQSTEYEQDHALVIPIVAVDAARELSAGRTAITNLSQSISHECRSNALLLLPAADSNQRADRPMSPGALLRLVSVRRAPTATDQPRIRRADQLHARRLSPAGHVLPPRQAHAPLSPVHIGPFHRVVERRFPAESRSIVRRTIPTHTDSERATATANVHLRPRRVPTVADDVLRLAHVDDDYG